MRWASCNCDRRASLRATTTRTTAGTGRNFAANASIFVKQNKCAGLDVRSASVTSKTQRQAFWRSVKVGSPMGIVQPIESVITSFITLYWAALGCPVINDANDRNAINVSVAIYDDAVYIVSNAST
jgi:Na+-driven multidrug efflux pump